HWCPIASTTSASGLGSRYVKNTVRIVGTAMRATITAGPSVQRISAIALPCVRGGGVWPGLRRKRSTTYSRTTHTTASTSIVQRKTPVNRSLIAAPNSVTGRNVVCGYSPEQAASRETATIGRSAASGRTLSVRRGIPSFSIILPEGRRVNGFGPIATRQIITRDNRGQA